ncbi:uncharacterized protein MONBRDRAFT_16317, partial [Monosiga brevicollis MX1]
GFDSIFTKALEISHLGQDKVCVTVTVTKGLLNSYGMLHGGATMTIIDIVGTLALLSRDVNKAGVSVEVNTSFISAAREGEQLIAEGRVLRLGRKLGYTQVDIINPKTGQLVATGRHTKAV